MIEIRPIRKTEIALRSNLLNENLHSADSLYSIEEEYPLVLSPANLDRSHVLVEKGHLIAHANLLVRKLLKNKECAAKIGLIGNVTSDIAHRGKGYIRKLFNYFESIANSESLDYLLLWSDLDEFYAKLGFVPVGRETRLAFHSDNFKNNVTRSNFKAKNIIGRNASELTSEELMKLISLRPKTPLELERELSDFKKQVSIPDTYLVELKENNDVSAYTFVGRGSDFIGVAYEWGFVPGKASLLTDIISFIIHQTDLEQLLLIGPSNIPEMKELEKSASDVEETHMALAKKTNPQKKNDIDWLESYIWGLDSI